MRHIEKLEEPQYFAQWKTKYPTATYADLGHDRLFPGAQQARWCLRNALLNEQRGLCCYCETLITNGDFHIEHFRPKDSTQFLQLQLTYSNLHACCRKQPCGGKDEYCGHKKANAFSPLLISPLDIDCATHFQYDMSGRIIGMDLAGTETISLLKLDSVLLTRSRKQLIEDFEDMEDEEYESEIAYHLNPQSNPLGEFFTTIEYLHSQRLLHK